MILKDDFATSALKMLLSVISLVIIFPVANKTGDIALCITVSVFMLGKLLDFISKVSQRQLLVLNIFYILGVIIGIVAIGMCFYGFSAVTEKMELSLAFNGILVCLAASYSFIDLIEFIYCIARTIYTKALLHHFVKNA